MRQDWDTYFAQLASITASRATCPRRSVGAVIVKDNRIKATGYNGAPSGLSQCDTHGCLMKNDRCIRTIHAEANALLQTSPLEREDATIYITDTPCWSCALLIANSGIKHVHATKVYRDFNDVRKLLHAAGISVNGEIPKQ